MTSLAEAFGLGRGCFGREGVLRCTGTFPETGGHGVLYLLSCQIVDAYAFRYGPYVSV